VLHVTSIINHAAFVYGECASLHAVDTRASATGPWTQQLLCCHSHKTCLASTMLGRGRDMTLKVFPTLAKVNAVLKDFS